MLNSLKIIILQILLLIYQSYVESAKPQQISFYSENNKNGVRDTFINSIVVPIPDAVKNAKSYCVDQGLWKITVDVLTAPLEDYTEFLGGNLGYEYCNDLTNGRPLYKSVEFIGSNDLELPSLSLFEKGKFQGVITTVNEIEISFPEIRRFNSYYMTGISNWALYNNTNYSGQVTCLEAQTDSIRTYGSKGVSYMESLPVGSIRQGCEGDEFTSTRRPIDEGGSGASTFSKISTYNLFFIQIIILIFLYFFY